jgi:hypothetical protein
VTLGTKLERRRAARDAARTALTDRFDQVRDDLAERSIGGRIVDKVSANAAEAATEVVEVVRTNKAVVAGTLFALIAWVFRHPILALFGVGGSENHQSRYDDDKEWNA